MAYVGLAIMSGAAGWQSMITAYSWHSNERGDRITDLAILGFLLGIITWFAVNAI